MFLHFCMGAGDAGNMFRTVFSSCPTKKGTTVGLFGSKHAIPCPPGSVPRLWDFVRIGNHTPNSLCHSGSINWDLKLGPKGGMRMVRCWLMMVVLDSAPLRRDFDWFLSYTFCQCSNWATSCISMWIDCQLSPVNWLLHHCGSVAGCTVNVIWWTLQQFSPGKWTTYRFIHDVDMLFLYKKVIFHSKI